MVEERRKSRVNKILVPAHVGLLLLTTIGMARAEPPPAASRPPDPSQTVPQDHWAYRQLALVREALPDHDLRREAPGPLLTRRQFATITAGKLGQAAAAFRGAGGPPPDVEGLRSLKHLVLEFSSDLQAIGVDAPAAQARIETFIQRSGATTDTLGQLVLRTREKIQPSGPFYVFNLYSVPAHSSYHYRIEVRTEGGSRIFVSGHIRNGWGLEGDSSAFQIVDVDSDGCRDIRILGGFDLERKRAWHKIWRYDPASNTFVWLPEKTQPGQGQNLSGGPFR